MESELLFRRVSVLQACVRGFLVRRRFQSLRAEYESVVRDIEGHLDTLQWTAGRIPRPTFLPEKAKSHCCQKAGQRVPNPVWELRSPFTCKKPEKEAIWEEMAPKKSGESSALPESHPRRDSSPRLQAEQDNNTRNPSQQETKAKSEMEYPESVSPGLLYSQHELQELQYHRSHLAMELLWLQQAINSRKEYLILKQTLRPPEAGHTTYEPCQSPEHGGQAWPQPSLLQQSQAYGGRTTGQLDLADVSCPKGKSQPHKSPESLATTKKPTAGARGKELCCQRLDPQLPAPSASQAGGYRATKKPDLEEQTLKGAHLQKTTLLEDRGRKPKSPGSGKARRQLPALCEDPDVEAKSPRKPNNKETDYHGARPRQLGHSKDHIIWDRTLEGPELGHLDLREIKPPKGQIPRDKTCGDGLSSELSHEGWKSQRTVLWESRPPENLSSTELAEMGGDHGGDRPWKTGPPG
ncbi:IQ domain-containing protein C [Ctenodactylus gundi]